MQAVKIPLALAILLGSLAASCASSGAAYTPGEPATAPPPPIEPTPDDMARTMAELAAAGPEHDALAQLAGEWTLEYRIRFPPGEEWTHTTGTASARAILGGRYLLEEHRFTLGGQPYEGWLIRGYDALAREHVSLWMDTASTWWSEARGRRDAGGAITMRGMLKDAAGARAFRTRDTTTADGTLQHEMYDTVDGREELVMTYTRRRK